MYHPSVDGQVLQFNKRKINSTTCPGSYRCIGDLSGLQV